MVVSLFLLLIFYSFIATTTSQRLVQIADSNYTLPLRIALLYDGECSNDTQCSTVKKRESNRASLYGLPLALDTINRNPDFYLFHNLTVQIQNTKGLPSESSEQVVNAGDDSNLVAIIGAQRSCDLESELATVYNKLLLNFNCMPNENQHTTTGSSINLSFSVKSYAEALVTVLKEFDWTNVAIFQYSDHPNDINLEFFSSLAATVNEKLKLENINIASSCRGCNVNKFILESFLNTRIFIIFGSDQQYRNLNRFLYFAYQLGLLQTGEYFLLTILPPTSSYLSYQQESIKFFNFDFLNTTLTFDKMINIYRSVGVILLQPPELFSFYEFRNKIDFIQTRKYCPDLCPSNQSTLQNLFQYRQAALLYDTFVFYANITTQLAVENITDIDEGSTLSQYFYGESFQSVLGQNVIIDVSSEAWYPFTLLSINRDDENSGLVPVAQIYAQAEENPFYNIDWISGDGFQWSYGRRVVSDPKCGFRGEKCKNTKDFITEIASGISLVLLCISIVVVVLLYRHYKYEKQLYSLIWKIISSDLSVEQINSTSRYSLKSMGSVMMDKQSTFNVNDQVQNGQVKNRNEFDYQVESDLKREKLNEIEEFAIVVYNKNVVALKRIHKANIVLTRTIRKELKMIRELRHENINHVHGAVCEPPLIFIVSDYCQRGALKDILENEEIQLDTIFTSSIVFDIIKGMTFIHRSELMCHGNLKSSNCLVDSRWSVRLSNFGLDEFKSGEESRKTQDQMNESLLWTAPEILRNAFSSKSQLKSQKGDIYSFGIILHEIFARKGTFGDDLVMASDILHQLKFPKDTNNPLRPDTKIIVKQPKCVVETMKMCWNEVPERRPNFVGIKLMLTPLRKGLKSNMFDNMMAMMEKYSNNLEQVVFERTRQLDEEQKKTDRLLRTMLPESVAEQLKLGNNVDPVSYECVTIYFSDMTNFASVSLSSTPFEIVDFLNELYRVFDSIVEMFAVYKVETIGDAYMVVSGLPELNGDNHAGEIASMALELVGTAQEFEISHKPGEKVQLRIGIHSGSCVAGVVGLKMPSRMESNGQALKIHCSAQCKRILDVLGGYETIERGLVLMKGKGEQLTYWLNSDDKEMRKKRLLIESEKYSSIQKLLQ